LKGGSLAWGAVSFSLLLAGGVVAKTTLLSRTDMFHFGAGWHTFPIIRNLSCASLKFAGGQPGRRWCVFLSAA
jgi:hypothetical protein